MESKQETPAPADPQGPPPTQRCRRCRKHISNAEQETFFLRTGLCFWCAYVDTQG